MLRKLPRRVGRRCLSEDSPRRSYYFLYTFCFLLGALCVFWVVLRDGKSLVWYKDGWTQHHRALVFYSRYLRQIFQTLFTQGRLVVPGWDFTIGEGSDVLNALHYYVIGDPIAFFSVLVPEEGMHLFLSLTCVLRMYLGGIAFSALAFGTGKRDRAGILAGALSYAFCAWMVYCAGRHPYFLNPAIYFPWMLLGIEKVIRRERPYVFLTAAAVSAMSNFYFFYMIAVLAILYALIRLGFVYGRDWRQGLKTLLHMGVLAVIGVCIAGSILAPVILIFLSDSRAGLSQPFHLFYPLGYYSTIPGQLMSATANYWLLLGFSAPAVLALGSLFLRRREQPLLKVLLGVCVLILLFPFLGRVLNGMGYMTNRWSWALALLSAYILTAQWERLMSLSRRDWGRLALFCGVYLVLLLVCRRSRVSGSFAGLCVLLLTLAVLRPESRRPGLRRALVLGLVLLSLGRSAYFLFDPLEEGYSSELLNTRDLAEAPLREDAAALMTVTGEDEYPRFTGRKLDQNTNLTNGISSTQYYWTVSNPYVNRYRTDLEFAEPLYSQISNYDDRTTPIALSGSRYYCTTEAKAAGLPYGLVSLGKVDVRKAERLALVQALKEELGVKKLTTAQNNRLAGVRKLYYLYENPYALPLTYTYTKYLTQETWDRLNPVQRQQIQLEAALVSQPPEELTQHLGTMDTYELDYTVTCGSVAIDETETGFVSTTNKATFTLDCDRVPDAEVYVSLEGIDVTRTMQYDLYFGDESVDPKNLFNRVNWDLLSDAGRRSIRTEKRYWSPVVSMNLTVTAEDGFSKTITYKSPDATFSSGRRDFLVNLGYREAGISSVTVTLPNRGRYDFSAIHVYAVPMTGFAQRIEALREKGLENLTLDTDFIGGDIELTEPRLLVLAFPYSTGWSAEVDGEPAPVLVANGHYLGLSLTPGAHRVELRYRTPFLGLGLFLTAAGLAAFVVVALLERRKRARAPGSRQQERAPGNAG